jgi:hypothetical protein
LEVQQYALVLLGFCGFRVFPGHLYVKSDEVPRERVGSRLRAMRARNLVKICRLISTSSLLPGAFLYDSMRRQNLDENREVNLRHIDSVLRFRFRFHVQPSVLSDRDFLPITLTTQANRGLVAIFIMGVRGARPFIHLAGFYGD